MQKIFIIITIDEQFLAKKIMKYFKILFFVSFQLLLKLDSFFC